MYISLTRAASPSCSAHLQTQSRCCMSLEELPLLVHSAVFQDSLMLLLIKHTRTCDMHRYGTIESREAMAAELR